MRPDPVYPDQLTNTVCVCLCVCVYERESESSRGFETTLVRCPVPSESAPDAEGAERNVG